MTLDVYRGRKTTMQQQLSNIAGIQRHKLVKAMLYLNYKALNEWNK